MEMRETRKDLTDSLSIHVYVMSAVHRPSVIIGFIFLLSACKTEYIVAV